MKLYLVLTAIAAIIFACGTSSNPNRTTSAEKLAAMKQRVEELRPLLPTCHYPNGFIGVSKDTCSAEKTGSGDADTMLFSGLLCLSGEKIGCDTALRSFSPNGQPHRSPARLTENDLSRDMMMGILAYLVGTKDIKTAKLFQKWLYANNKRLCIDACTMTQPVWGTMGEVWKYLGLPLTLEMRAGMLTDDLAQMASAQYNDLGYTEHLVAVHVLIRQATDTNTATYDKVVDILVKKDPNNPFFQWLDGNLTGAIDLCLTQATYTSHKREWTIERADPYDSMGWEFVFLYNLMLKF